MKIALLLIPVLLCGFISIVVGQQNLQFIYVGSEPRTNEGVLITSTTFQGDYLKGKDSPRTKIYYTNQRILDTLRSYISHSHLVKRGDRFMREHDEIDAVKLIDAFKIVGAGADPFFITGKD